MAWAEVGSRPFEITPSEQYQLSATVMGQTNGAVGLGDDYGIWVEYFDPSGVVLAHTKVLSGELPIEATELTAEIEAPQTAVMMRLIIASHGLNGWVTYDNLFVERMPEEQVKVRKTYLFAGQPIAQRTEITSNAGLLQDELHYIFTDHLGSASTVTDDAGEVVDVSRFFPFGEYRTEPTAEITERGFTGHHENRDIGLTYMNARFYVPYANRFLTPDSIVPNPANPQSLNRYSYVRNNPLIFSDPSGHVEVCHSNGCSNLVKFDQNEGGEDVDQWTEEEMQTVIDAANAVAEALFNASPEGQYSTAGEAFLDVYGAAVYFAKTNSACAQGCWGKSHAWHDVQGVNRRHVIEVYTNANLSFRNSGRWAVHELGHSFVNSGAANRPISTLSLYQSLGFPDRPTPPDPLNPDADNDEGYDPTSHWGFAGPRYSWQRTWEGTASEEFADMFVGWTYNQWGNTSGVLSVDGQRRARFMNLHMEIWLDNGSSTGNGDFIRSVLNEG